MSEDDRYLLFVAGFPDSELDLVAGDQPPSEEWMQDAAEHAPASDDERIGSYCDTAHRQRPRRPLYYEGSGTSHASSAAHVGVVERTGSHVMNVKNKNYKKKNFLCHTMRPDRAQIKARLTWAVSYPPRQLRKRALLYVLRVVFKHGVKAPRHELFNSYLDQRPYVGAGLTARQPRASPG